MGRNFGVTFEVGAKAMGTVASTFATVESRIKGLKTSAKELTVYQAKATALTTAAARLQDKKSAYAANPTAVLKKELDAAQRAFNSAEKSAAKYNITVANSAEVQARTTAAIKNTEQALARQEKLQANQAKRRELHGRIMGTVATAATVAAPIKMAMDFETAMADVKKVTNFDAPGFAQFSRDMLKLSTEIPMAADGLAQIAAAAGQAGIAEVELLRFTKDAAVMAVAFDITADEAGSAMTGLRTNFKLGQDGVIGLGDSFNQLANNMGATAGQIINFATRAGRVGTMYNFSGEQMGALGAAFIAMKMPAEVAARATNALFMKLGMADKSTKEAQKAFKNLGIPAKQMARMFHEDAQGALLAFLEAAKKSKDPMKELRAILGEGFADEVAGLVGGLDEYKKALGLIGDKSRYAGSMQMEYSARAATTANSLTLMKNAASRLGVIMGSTLLPAIAAVADKTVQLLEPVARLAEEYPQVTTAIFGIMGGLAAFKVVGLAGAYAATLLSDGLVMVKGALALVRGGVVALIPAVRALGVALLANPVGLVVLAVVALAAGLYLLYQKSETARMVMNKIWEILKTIGRNVMPVMLFPLVAVVSLAIAAWEPLKAFFIEVWESLKIGAAAVWNAIGAGAAWCADTAQAVWNGVVGFFAGVWEKVKGPAVVVFETIAAAAAWCVDFLRPVWEPIAGFFSAVWEGIKAPAVAVFEWISEKFEWIAGKFKWLADTWGKLKGWFSDDKDVTVTKAEAKVKAAVAAETVTVQPTSTGFTAPITAARPVAHVAQPQFTAPTSTQPVFDLNQPVPVKFDSSSFPKFEQPAPQIQAPVTQEFNFTMTGMPDKEFADRVVESIKSRSGALESIIAKIVANIMARQKRLAYDS